MDEAIVFYAHGFFRIFGKIESLYTAHLSEPGSEKSKSFGWDEFVEVVKRFFLVLKETLFAVIFWAGVGFLFWPEARERLIDLFHR